MFDVFGPCIRTIPVDPCERVLYLSFDDGPDPIMTPKVLKILDKFRAKATFFMVANRAKAHSKIVSDVVAGNHTIGNHSLDHDTTKFFSSYNQMLDWIQQSESVFHDNLGLKSIGFRSPAGVQTPILHRALRALKLPLVHWDKRFFDSTFGWIRSSALRSLDRARSGQIILLHDHQKPGNESSFLEALEAYLQKGQDLGISFKAITPEDISRCLK